MSEFYIYILYSKSLDRYYIGSSHNVEIRFVKHLQSKKGFTSKAKDWAIVYSENFTSRTLAVRRELQIKKWKSRVMIEKLIAAG
ncbi:GIY-YIG nuclease family protein [Salegentibacter sp. HM20]